MEPVTFPEHNTVYAKNQSEYKPLPVFKNDSPQGEVISCWKLSFRERLRILFTGRLWVCLLSFNHPLTPSFFTTKKSEVLVTYPRENNLPKHPSPPPPPPRKVAVSNN